MNPPRFSILLSIHLFRMVINVIANVKGLSMEQVAEAAYQNTMNLFFKCH
jgi:Tat protein secretion system quality control protein TatD with DNase activity